MLKLLFSIFTYASSRGDLIFYRLKIISVTFCIVFSAAGCASGPELKGSQKKPVRNKAPVLNWSHPKSVTIILNEYSISESGSDAPFIELTAGEPYNLIIKNEGRKFHIFEAASFFRTAVISKISFGKNTEAVISRIGRIKVGAGKSVTLLVIPLKKGDYGVICALKLHLNAGMRSRIAVRERLPEK